MSASMLALAAMLAVLRTVKDLLEVERPGLQTLPIVLGFHNDDKHLTEGEMRDSPGGWTARDGYRSSQVTIPMSTCGSRIIECYPKVELRNCVICLTSPTYVITPIL